MVPIARDHVYCMLQECTRLQNLEFGRQLHFLMVYNGLDSVAALADHIIRLFSGKGNVFEANQAFNKVANPTQYTWSAFARAQANLGEGALPLEFYDKIGAYGKRDNGYICVALLQACVAASILHLGRCIHEYIIEVGLNSNVVVGNTIIDMYIKCGSLEEASQVFQELTKRDIVSWNAMISGYGQWGDGLQALHCFNIMQYEGIKPDSITFSSMFKGCAVLGATEYGRYVHQQMIKRQLPFNLIVSNSLVDMYAKCRSLKEAWMVFSELPTRDLVSWNTMISGYAQHHEGFFALNCFRNMQQEGIKPDRVTFLCVLQACANIVLLEWGRYIHVKIIESGLESDTFLGSTLIDMYSKCSSLDEAGRIFVRLQKRNAVSWNAMIGSFAQHGKGLLVLEYYENMQHSGINPDAVTYPSILKACGSIGAIGQGRYIHEMVIERGLCSHFFVGSALVDMYAKCGSLEESESCFQRLQTADVASWNTMISGYAQLGDAKLAVQCFDSLHSSGTRPDNFTFTSLLDACNHAGLVEEGHEYFTLMTKSYDIEPNIFHLNCMVDLLGRFGSFKEAEDLMKTSVQPNFASWRVLLTACALHANMQLGRRCFEEISHLEFSCSQANITNGKQ